MFYAQFVLSKKGPLSKIWLAAHWERKLSKAQVFETNVQDAVDEILEPKVKLSLRTTGHLLLGIVRIYSRKAKYVLADCNEAFLKIKMAFLPGTVENEFRKREDRDGGDIPEMINDFYDVLPDINHFEIGNIGHLSINQSRIDDITLREENFETSSQRGLAFDGELGLDDFGEREQQDFSNFSFEVSNVLQNENRMLDFSGVEEGRREKSLDRHSFQQNSQNITLIDDERPKSNQENVLDNFADDFVDDFGTATDLDMLFNENDLNRELYLGPASVQPPGGLELENCEMEVDQIVPQNVELSTQESFALEPLDTDALQQQVQEKVVRQKRKRRLVFDENKNIRGDEMKSNMNNYCDTMQLLDLAPPTKFLMRLKENGTAEKLFTVPGCIDGINDPYILRLYQSHLVLNARDVNDTLSEDIRRDLEMVENLEDDFYSHPDDDLVPSSPTGNLIDIFGDNEVNENLEPFDNGSMNGNDTIFQTSNPNDLIIPEEKRNARRSRIQEKEEEEYADDEEIFTRRTKTILNSIAQKLRTNDKIFFHDILTRGTRRTAAQKFYALLELHKRHAIKVEQLVPFGPIEITAGISMDDTLALTPQ